MWIKQGTREAITLDIALVYVMYSIFFSFISGALVQKI